MAQTSKSSKVLVIIIVVITAIVIGAVCTCPDSLEHKNALSDKMSLFVRHKLDQSDNALVDNLVKLGVSAYLDNKFSVDNYYVCSVGKLQGGKSDTTVTFGIFGHVFTPTEEQMQDKLDDLQQELQQKLKNMGNDILNELTNVIPLN